MATPMEIWAEGFVQVMLEKQRRSQNPEFYEAMQQHTTAMKIDNVKLVKDEIVAVEQDYADRLQKLKDTYEGDQKPTVGELKDIADSRDELKELFKAALQPSKIR